MGDRSECFEHGEFRGAAFETKLGCDQESEIFHHWDLSLEPGGRDGREWLGPPTAADEAGGWAVDVGGRQPGGGCRALGA